MWTTVVRHKTRATKNQIWKLWADVPNWPLWDKDVESAELFGEFKAGTTGIMKPSVAVENLIQLAEKN